MKVFDSEKVRNVALVGHGDSGKTSLTSAFLFLTGATNRLGQADDGNSVTDYDDDEIARKITINTSVAHCEWKQHKINLVDTPGYPAFILDAKSSLVAADTALVVIDAVSGVEVQTEKVWSFAEDHALPRALVINKLDRDRSSFGPRPDLGSRGLRQKGYPGPDSNRRRERFQRDYRPDRAESLSLQDRRQRKVRGGCHT